jgi:glucosylceramidase
VAHRVRSSVVFVALAVAVPLGIAAVLLGIPGPAGEQPAASNQVRVVITTANLSAQLRTQPPLTLSPTVPSGPKITVDPTVRYQHFTGVGAAITDSSADLISRLPATTVTAPFGVDTGHGYFSTALTAGETATFSWNQPAG